MEHLLLIIIGILLLIIFVLCAKVYFLRKSAREITEAFRDRLTADTNTLMDISSRDQYMRKLAAEINVQLRLLRKERQRYQQGDLELKEAVTNISHDLRTPFLHRRCRTKFHRTWAFYRQAVDRTHGWNYRSRISE